MYVVQKGCFEILQTWAMNELAIQRLWTEGLTILAFTLFALDIDPFNQLSYIHSTEEKAELD